MKIVKKFTLKMFALITSLIIIGGGMSIAWIMNQGINNLPLQQFFSREYTNAVWDWSNILNKSDADLQRMSKFMYLHQLNAVYVDVSRYAAIDANTKLSKQEKANRTAALDTALRQYISVLQKRHIKVYAAAGDTSWSTPDQWDMPRAVLKAAQRFNDTYPKSPLAGVEFDIEAYNQAGFSEGSSTVKALTLTDFLDMADMLATETANYIKQTQKPFELGFAIPYWFDNQNGNIPSVAWRDKTGPTLYHLLDRLNQLPQSNVVVMAYRNAARGNDGTIHHSRTEIEYAQAKAPRVGVVIGQELTDVEPAKITFYGRPTAELSSQIKMVTDELGVSGVLRGIAINDLQGFEELAAN